MKMRAKNILLLIAVGIAAPLAFQNCGTAFQPMSTFPGKASADLAYPYSSKPFFYADLALFKSKKIEGLNAFDIYAAVRAADDSGTDYIVDVTNPDGDVLCPQRTGTLTPETTLITFSCVSAFLSDEVYVRLALRSGSQKQVIEKSFAN